MKKAKDYILLMLVSIFALFYVGNLFDAKKVYESFVKQNVKNVTVLDQENAIFEGVVEVPDTPWNVNAGRILMEDGTTCLFLTPNTSVEMELQNESLCFSYRIHPWVNQHSDGAGIIIWLLDEKNEIVCEEIISISAEADWKRYQLNLGKYSEAQKVKILCNNGIADDDSCDWVIIK